MKVLNILDLHKGGVYIKSENHGQKSWEQQYLNVAQPFFPGLDSCSTSNSQGEFIYLSLYIYKYIPIPIPRFQLALKPRIIGYHSKTSLSKAVKKRMNGGGKCWCYNNGTEPAKTVVIGKEH